MIISENVTGDILKGKKHIHMIGIGGSGMYPLAQIMKSRGFEISGSDNNQTETLDAVRKMGIEVFMGQRAENIEGADLIVYTAAIMPDNPELIAAKESDIPTIERKDLLGIVTSWYNKAVCISGTHGKTTATSMLTQIFVQNYYDISCFIGGKLPLIGGSGRSGSSDIMVCESCEFVDTFLKLFPDIAVILNIDEDHLDYFKNLDNIIKSFNKFAGKATDCLVINGDDANTLKAIENIDKPKITFGFGENNNYIGKIKYTKGLETCFELYVKGEYKGDLSIFVAGKHNVLNALAACACADYLGVSFEQIKSGLAGFAGAIRRFEKIDTVNGVTIVDDYAHHPTEIAATLTAAKSLDFKRVWAVFQPFTYSRTEILMDEFVQALNIADKVVLTDIMGSREKNINKTYTRDLGEKIDGCIWFDYPDEIVDEQTAEQKEKNFSDITDYLKANVQEGDLIVTMGCGDVYKLAKKFAKEYKQN